MVGLSTRRGGCASTAAAPRSSATTSSTATRRTSPRVTRGSWLARSRPRCRSRRRRGRPEPRRPGPVARDAEPTACARCPTSFPRARARLLRARSVGRTITCGGRVHMTRLRGRVALVTGGGSGIGRASALRLAEEGASVVVTDIRDRTGEAVAAEIRSARGTAVFHHHDVADEAAWASAVQRAASEFDGLDVLGIKAAARLLKASPHASVINISSIFGASGGFGTSPAYHAAKGAVRILTKNVALHWADSGVRVNSVHPGFIDTPILDPVRGTAAEQAMIASTPMGRLGTPSEVAAAVAFLASDDASFMTGAELYVDGGYVAR